MGLQAARGGAGDKAHGLFSAIASSTSEMPPRHSNRIAPWRSGYRAIDAGWSSCLVRAVLRGTLGRESASAQPAP